MTRTDMKRLAQAGSFPGETDAPERTPIWFAALVLVLVTGVPLLVASVARW